MRSPPPFETFVRLILLPRRNAKPWLDLEDSFSPAIHNIQNTLIFRLSEPDGELPPVPESIVKYLDPPQSVVDNSKEAREALIAAFDVRRGASSFLLSPVRAELMP